MEKIFSPVKKIIAPLAGMFKIPEMPSIPAPPAPPALTENMPAAPAADKEKSAAAEAERRRALAKYGKRTRTLLTGPMGRAAAGMTKRLLGE